VITLFKVGDSRDGMTKELPKDVSTVTAMFRLKIKNAHRSVDMPGRGADAARVGDRRQPVTE
jgi:hypothetical protein